MGEAYGRIFQLRKKTESHNALSDAEKCDTGSENVCNLIYFTDFQLVIIKSHNEMISEWMEYPVFKAEYDALENEFALFDELIKARKKAGLTQAEVARRMGAKIPAIARLESGGGSKHRSPSVATINKYAEAVGCRLEIKLHPLTKTPNRL